VAAEATSQPEAGSAGRASRTMTATRVSSQATRNGARRKSPRTCVQIQGSSIITRAHELTKRFSERQLDRYIPSRQTGNGEHTGPILLPTSSSAPEPTSQTAEDAQHTADLSRSLGINQEQRILSFFAEPPLPQTEHNSLLSQYARLPNKGSAASASSAASAASRRRIPTQPDRVLDAPGMLDDYYLNLLDWSTTNLLAIALAEVVYVWNAQTGTVTELCQVGNSDSSVLLEGDEYICSVKFTEDGSHLAVGLASGPIQVYDVTAGQLVRTMSGHPSRVPSLSWSGAILASGCRSGEIWNSDVRVAQHCVAQMRGHRGEVCGLEWRPEVAGGLSGGGQGVRNSIRPLLLRLHASVYGLY
jgi:cell division cycle protein 20 (cofactor of APC complex)